MQRFISALGVFSSLFAVTAHADIIFSNVQITGSLAGGAAFVPTASDISFTFPSALVGDGEALRTGTLQVTFEALSDVPLTFDLLRLDGAIDGTGELFVNEVIEDLSVPEIIATYSDTLDSTTSFPYDATLGFSHSATHIKVKKAFTLTALDSPAIDHVTMTGMNQSFVPEPTSLALLGLGLVAGLRRRS